MASAADAIPTDSPVVAKAETASNIESTNPKPENERRAPAATMSATDRRMNARFANMSFLS